VLQQMLDDVARRELSIEPLITGIYAIDDGAAAGRDFENGSLGKVLLIRP